MLLISLKRIIYYCKGLEILLKSFKLLKCHSFIITKIINKIKMNKKRQYQLKVNK